MNSIHNRGDEGVKAPDAHSHTSPGAEGWKDVLQLLQERSVKMEKLARALGFIQQVILRNNPGHVNKPVGDASSYRPICLLDTMGKLLEEMILQRLQGQIVRENGLSENQFGFRNGRSTVDAIQAVVDIATKARRGIGKRKGFCALISIDIRNAFNTAR